MSLRHFYLKTAVGSAVGLAAFLACRLLLDLPMWATIIWSILLGFVAMVRLDRRLRRDERWKESD